LALADIVCHSFLVYTWFYYWQWVLWYWLLDSFNFIFRITCLLLLINSFLRDCKNIFLHILFERRTNNIQPEKTPRSTSYLCRPKQIFLWKPNRRR
jgi:hypothetical protein